MKNLLTFFLLFISTATAFAQEQSVEMADTMRSNGKIYVVVGIIMIILAGFILYLFMLDKKISRLEKEIKK